MRLDFLTASTLGFVITGCVAVRFPAASPGAGEGRVTLIVAPRPVSPRAAQAPYALQGFTQASASDLRRLLVTVVDVTDTPTVVAQQDASSTYPIFSYGPPQMRFTSMRPYRRYRVEVKGYGILHPATPVTADAQSSTIVDTMPTTASGAIPLLYRVDLPVQMLARPFPGKLDVMVEGVATQDGMEVVLQVASGAAGFQDLVSTTAQGNADRLVAYEGLAIDQVYRVVRRPFRTPTGSLPPSPIPEQVASVQIDTASTSLQVDEAGVIASRVIPLLPPP